MPNYSFHIRQHLFIAKTHHTQPHTLKRLITYKIVFFLLLVYFPIHFDDQMSRMTVKIGNVASNDLLATEMHTQSSGF